MTDLRPLIFITNDDGISSKGIRSLYEAVAPFGDIVLIAPDSPQSGMGHAITINHPLRLESSSLFDCTSYSCTGTPVDCVKLGVYEVMHRKPDLIVSGINHGANVATNVLYSGTMSAAVEGAMEGIPSIGFSLSSFESDADFDLSKEIVAKVVKEVLEQKMPIGVCLNVNIPDVSKNDFKGIKICKQANAYWDDRFDKRKDQFNRTYYWLTGDFIDQDKSEDTDVYWIDQGYATIVPTQYDLTAYSSIKELENWNL
ncbi:MAG: 5'/3'-nucleotidase SurE [Crocinitomicaceae bacterium]|nr:5'/3'-nucleotidase SurE [Flavobacteriales bacterium]NQZ37554.1 5'/3'-nucleotidase SurE [Crocinitomicaceae bacterium]